MNLTRFAITNDRVTAILVVAVLLGGYSAYLTMEQAMDPGFTIRTAQIITRFPGANPDRVEALVTDQIEKAIQQIPELNFVNSTSKTGVSIISVNIRNEFTDMRPIWDKLRRKVDEVARSLPEGALAPEVNDEFGDVYGTIIAVTGDGFDYRELKDFALQLRDGLLRLENVGKVYILGMQDERVFVEYNDARLAELNLSVSQVSQILQTRNILISGGSLLAGEERLELEPSGNFNTVEELARTVISAPSRPDLLYLEDIAEISRGYVNPPASKVRANGLPALVLALSVREGGNIVTQELLERVRNQYPLGGRDARAFSVANGPAGDAVDRAGIEPDDVGLVNHRAGHARRQRDRHERVDHGVGVRGDAPGGGGCQFGKRASDSAADLVADYLRCFPSDLPRRGADGRVHRRFVCRRHDYPALLLAARIDTHPASLRPVPQSQACRRRGRLQHALLPGI
jgi:hypothetical protein